MKPVGQAYIERGHDCHLHLDHSVAAGNFGRGMSVQASSRQLFAGILNIAASGARTLMDAQRLSTRHRVIEVPLGASDASNPPGPSADHGGHDMGAFDVAVAPVLLAAVAACIHTVPAAQV